MNGSPAYRQAGVNIDAGNALVERIKPLAKATARAGVMGGIGGFGALFDLKAAGYKDPILVSSTDGVGTKLKVAQAAKQHHTIGIDLVAMCVNDLVVQGAEPLFFLDYFATGKLDIDIAAKVVEGIAEGCKQTGCALVGGETAEMPGLYQDGEYDLAGFTVGVVERDRLLPRGDIQWGDVVLGLPSSGIHSNGFSLVNAIVKQTGLAWNATAPFAPEVSLGQALLTPTRIYVQSVLSAIRAGGIKAIAHITGGGLLENIPRVLPENAGVALHRSTWEWLPVFAWLQEAGNISMEEMYRVFNCGIGMVLVVDAASAPHVIACLEQAGEQVLRIGQITPRQGDAVVIHD